MSTKTGKFVECGTCGQSIWRKYYKLKTQEFHFCSNSCRYKWNKGRCLNTNEHLIGVRLSPETEFKKGSQVGKKTQFKKGQRSYNKGKKFSKEYREKLSQAHKGINAKEKHPNWKGGIAKQSDVRVMTFEWRYVRKLAIERDNRECKICENRDTVLTVHHIVPYRICKNNNLDNLITLCRSCHMKEEWNV